MQREADPDAGRRAHHRWAGPPGDCPPGGYPGPGRRGRSGLAGRVRGLLRHGPAGSGPLRRAADGRMISGVAAGLAERTGFDVTTIRVVFVLAALISGLGAAPYVLAWLLVPAKGESGNIATK